MHSSLPFLATLFPGRFRPGWTQTSEHIAQHITDAFPMHRVLQQPSCSPTPKTYPRSNHNGAAGLSIELRLYQSLFTLCELPHLGDLVLNRWCLCLLCRYCSSKWLSQTLRHDPNAAGRLLYGSCKMSCSGSRVFICGDATRCRSIWDVSFSERLALRSGFWGTNDEASWIADLELRISDKADLRLSISDSGFLTSSWTVA